MDSVNIFTCMGFDEPQVCLHTFCEHTLFYVYSGSMVFPESKKWLFDFSVNPLHLLDVMKNPESTPMEWLKINAECPISLN